MHYFKSRQHIRRYKIASEKLELSPETNGHKLSTFIGHIQGSGIWEDLEKYLRAEEYEAPSKRW
jgi:hypothetical protein